MGELQAVVAAKGAVQGDLRTQARASRHGLRHGLYDVDNYSILFPKILTSKTPLINTLY